MAIVIVLFGCLAVINDMANGANFSLVPHINAWEGLAQVLQQKASGEACISSVRA